MIQTFPLDSAVPVFVAAHVLLLLAVLAAVVKPHLPVLWISGLSTLGYAAFALLNLRVPAPHTFLWIAVVVALLGVGMTSARWSARLRVYSLTVQPKIFLGAVLGMIVTVLLFPSWGMLAQVIGLIAGASLGGMSPERGRPPGSPRTGPMALYALLGPRGFHFILTLLIADIATQHLFFRVGQIALPTVH